MAVEFDVQQPARITVRASGEVTFAEIEALISDIVAHPGWAAGADMMVETDGVESVPPTEQLREVANMMVPMLDRGLGALAVVAGNPFVYGVARVFTVFAESVGAKVSVFRKPEDASKWLEHRRVAVKPS